MSTRKLPTYQVRGEDPRSVETAIREIQQYCKDNFGHEVVDLGGSRIGGAGHTARHDDLVPRSELNRLDERLKAIERRPRSFNGTPVGPATAVAPGSDGGGGDSDPGGDLPNGCLKSASGGQFVAAVTTEIENYCNSVTGMADIPDRLHIVNEPAAVAYAAAVAVQITNGGYGLDAQVDPGDSKEIEIQFKSNPTFNEHYAIYTSFLTVRRPPGAYTATCSPPQV